MLKDYKNMAVLIDFDGTITDKDTNVELFNKKGDIKLNLMELNKSEESKDMTHLDKMNFIFDHIKIREEEYEDFILSNFKLTDGFKEFYDKLKEYNIPVAIISGGFKNGIDVFFKKHGIEGLDVYAHELEFNDRDIRINFYGDPMDCCENGPCGNCKILRYEEFKELKDNIVFIGDGFTDRWVASRAEILFAKSDLIKFCEDNKIDYIEWNDFNDISEILFK